MNIRQCVLLFSFFVIAACSQPKSKSPLPEEPPAAYAAVYGEQQAAVASVNPVATQAGLDALARGGNAVDAALAVAFTLGVVDSHNSGIGGGCFILARLADGTVLALDGREMAPQAAHRDMYIEDGVAQKQWSKTGALAAGIPGSVAALHRLQKAGGALSFADVLLPAADIAEQGFAIDKTMALRLASSADKLKRFPASARIFLDQSGRPLQAGDVLYQKDLAASYRKLAEQGPQWFYRGEFSKRTARWMEANNGLITEEDFALYRTLEREPVVTEYQGFVIYGFPPPSSGGVHVAQILSILDNFNLQGVSEADYYHLVAEAERRAFADRAHWMGDADFTPVPRNLISTEYAARLAETIDADQVTEGVAHGTPAQSAEELFGKHTTHIATADAQGNWVAITTTLNTSFGSKVVVPGTGVLLNNQMDDFVMEPGVPNAFGLVGSEANAIAPGKRPLSSMSPTLVFKGAQPVLTLGAAGGPTIISQVAQTLVRALAFDQSIGEAVAYPRVHHQWQPDLLFAEPSVDQHLQEVLVAKGHKIKSLGSFGGTQAIAWDGVEFLPVTEPRVIERNE